jgi:hypothetical protein
MDGTMVRLDEEQNIPANIGHAGGSSDAGWQWVCLWARDAAHQSRQTTWVESKVSFCPSKHVRCGWASALDSVWMIMTMIWFLEVSIDFSFFLVFTCFSKLRLSVLNTWRISNYVLVILYCSSPWLIKT